MTSGKPGKLLKLYLIQIREKITSLHSLQFMGIKLTIIRKSLIILIIFFVEIGPILAGKLDGTHLSPFNSYLTKNITTRFQFSNVSTFDVTNVIKHFNPKTSVGHDGISMKVVKLFSMNLLDCLTQVINQSLSTGIFPDKLKIAKILPIYKKEENNIFDNYRPISLLPTLSKVFERIVYNQLYSYFIQNKLLYFSQHGFRKLHSTETASLEFTDRIIQHLDNGKIPIAIFIDLSKAFDTIDHNILLHKLQYYGVTHNSLLWFKSYLTNRNQYVQFNDTSSSMLNIHTGVPQGSILGPLLFIIYVNDICFASSKFNAILYADDTSLESPLCGFDCSPNNVADVNTINSELTLIYNWFTVNKLSLNSKKTKFMVFHFPQMRNIPKLTISINGCNISQCSHFNFLGITIDETLSWRPHLQIIGNKISRGIGILKKLKHTLPTNTLVTLYISLILPHVYYGNLLWGFNHSNILKLQKTAVRVICNAKYNAHSSMLFKRLNILKVTDVHKLKCLKFYNRYCHGLIPTYFEGMFSPYTRQHNYNTRNRDEIFYDAPNRQSSRKSLRYYMPKLLAETPDCILDKINTHSFEGFSLYLKCYYLKTYQFLCYDRNCFVCSNMR